MKSITILGSTGSIGTQSLEVINQQREHYEVNYLTTNSKIDLLEYQTQLFAPKGVVIVDENAYRDFTKKTLFKGKILCGEEGLLEAAGDEKSDIVIVALVGFSGVKPTIEAIKNKKTIALANKEVLVVAGDYITKLATQNNTKIIPVDSEHSAIFQCLQGESISNVKKIILTASGGPFLDLPFEKLSTVTAKDALNHPT